MSDIGPTQHAPDVKVDIAFITVGALDIALRVGPDTLALSGVCWGTDGVGDLVRCVLALATGASVAECSFDLEPDELRLVAVRQVNDPATVEIKVYQLARRGAALSEGFLQGVARCATDDLATAVARASSDALEAKGLEGYRRLWGWDFPSRGVAALRAALALPPPSWGPIKSDDVTLQYKIIGAEPENPGSSAGSAADDNE